MKNHDKLIEIVEDHALLTHAIDSICCALENDTEMPNFIPVLHDAMVTDQLGRICESFTLLRNRAAK